MSEQPTTRPLARVRRLAWWLDSSIRLPGGYRIGFDGLIGLIPGIGDLTAAAMSSYIIVEAVRMRVPVNVLIRMGLNVLLEVIVGVIPVFGDLFDLAFKANERNVRLIEGYLDEPQQTQAYSRWVISAVVLAVVLILAATISIAVLVWQILWEALVV